jgi:DNA-binding MarR family transcriptional regulator
VRISSQRNKEQEKTNSSPYSDSKIYLWVLLDQATNLIRKARFLELKHFNVTPPEAEVLFILTHENRGLTLAEIANWNCRELNSILIRVNKMVKKGLVKKSRSIGERKVRVVVTERGRELYNSVTRQSLEMIFAVLSEEEKGQLVSSLNKLRTRTRDLLGVGFKPLFLP